MFQLWKSPFAFGTISFTRSGMSWVPFWSSKRCCEFGIGGGVSVKENIEQAGQLGPMSFHNQHRAGAELDYPVTGASQ